MAYLIGLVDEKEAAALEARGWQLKDYNTEGCQDELARVHESTNGTSDRLVMVFVDNGLLEIMSGPDWDTKLKEAEKP